MVAPTARLSTADAASRFVSSEGINIGGIGLLLTTMIISAPPMAAAFFQGTLGQFNAYSPFGHIKPEPPGGRGGGGYGPPGSPSYTPPPQNSSNDSRTRDAPTGTGFESQSAATGGAAYQPQQDERKQQKSEF